MFAVVVDVAVLPVASRGCPGISIGRMLASLLVAAAIFYVVPCVMVLRVVVLVHSCPVQYTNPYYYYVFWRVCAVRERLPVQTPLLY